MPRRVRQKWRPPLWFVLGGTLAAVFALPLLGLGYFRLAGNILGWGEAAAIIAGLALGITALLGWLLWRLVLRPVNALKSHATAVKNGAAAPLPEHFGTPEFSDLAGAVDEMAQTLQSREAGIRAYSNHVTHELRSPLTSIIAAAELLEEGVDPDDAVELAQSIKSASQRMEHLLGDLRELAAAREPFGRGSAVLSKVVDDMLAPVEMNVVADGALPLDEAALRAILDQFAGNAAAHGATRINLTAGTLTLVIHDDGAGVSEGDAVRIFDPFFTTRRAEGGTGMGLAIVRAMLEANGGTVAFVPSAAGARFEIRF